ncbi:MAG: hypothetical protein ABI488_27250 [Polyangiaceae bacterium]
MPTYEPQTRYAEGMLWSRCRFALTAGFALNLACASGCSSSAAGTSSNGGGGAGGGIVGVAGGGAAGAPNIGAAGVAGGGAAGVAGGGTAGTSSASGSAGTLSSAGTPGSAGATGDVSPCHARSGMLACDDFEAATVGAVPSGAWTAGINGDGTVTVDSSVPAHSGSKAVHVHGSGFQTLLVYHDATVLPQASGKFYVRAFVRLGAAMVGGHNTFVIADLFAAPGTGNALRLGEQNSMLMMTVGGDAHGYLSNQNFYNDQKPGVVFKVADYSCLELLLDSTHTEIEVWVDGVDVPDLHVSNLAHENYDALRFGFEQYAGPVSDIWYDDIAIGSERLGCD